MRSPASFFRIPLPVLAPDAGIGGNRGAALTPMRSIPLITVALALAALADTLAVGSGFNVVQPARYWGGPLTVSEPGVHEIAVDARLVGGSVENGVENNRRSRTVVFVEAGR